MPCDVKFHLTKGKRWHLDWMNVAENPVALWPRQPQFDNPLYWKCTHLVYFCPAFLQRSYVLCTILSWFLFSQQPCEVHQFKRGWLAQGHPGGREGSWIWVLWIIVWHHTVTSCCFNMKIQHQVVSLHHFSRAKLSSEYASTLWHLFIDFIYASFSLSSVLPSQHCMELG